MELYWSHEEFKFRDEVREFIKQELTEEVKGSMFINTPARVAFVDKMRDRDWLGLGFPEKSPTVSFQWRIKYSQHSTSETSFSSTTASSRRRMRFSGLT